MSHGVDKGPPCVFRCVFRCGYLELIYLLLDSLQVGPHWRHRVQLALHNIHPVEHTLGEQEEEEEEEEQEEEEEEEEEGEEGEEGGGGRRRRGRGYVTPGMDKSGMLHYYFPSTIQHHSFHQVCNNGL